MRVRILGPFEAAIDGSRIEISGRREKMLLARLALDPGQTLSVDVLADALWGEELPAKPTNAVQAAVSRLRKAIGRDRIVTRAPGYVLDVAPESIDAWAFSDLVRRAGEVDELRARTALLDEALALWRGVPLADFADEEFAQRDSGRLTELHHRAVEMQIEAAVEVGRHKDVIPQLEALIADNPLRESLRELHMLALYRAGRQADALEVYRTIRTRLAEELGVDPGPGLQHLELEILSHAPHLAGAGSVADTASRPLHNLPERLTSFIGRTTEAQEVGEALTTSRLVTLLGTGGAGKTSLAIEVARGLIGTYPHGVWLVELATAGPDEVADVVAGVLGVHMDRGFEIGGTEQPPASTRVIEALRDRRVLLVLDNCEHVIDAASDLTRSVLLACPHVDIVATSRERLGIPGEVVTAVPPLATAMPGESHLAGLLHVDSVRLFGERARAVNPAFRLDESNVRSVASICRRLDGMPLAIELAAARTASLPVGEIAARLGDVFRLLTGGARTAIERHQTLEATIGWSFALLSPDDRMLFCRLSVFRGSFDLEAASRVIDGDDMAVLDGLQRLIDRSMLNAVPAERPTYRMLETLRAFGAGQLEQLGEANPTHRRHFDHYRTVVRAAERHLRSAAQIEWLDRIDAVIENVRAALDWSLDNDPVAGVGLAGELGWWSYLRGARAEARLRIGRLLDAGGRAAPPHELGKALFAYAMADSAPNLAIGDLDEARALFEAAGDRWFATVCAAIASTFRAFYGDTAVAMQALDDAGKVMDELDDDWGRGLVEFLKANGATAANDFATIQTHVERAQRLFERSGDAWGIGYMDYFLGIIERSRGEYETATATFAEALVRARQLGLKHEIPVMLGEMANIATLLGEYARADALLDEALELADAAPFLGSQAMVHNARGLWWRHQGRNREAYESHRLAARMYLDTAREGGVAFAEGSAGRAAEALGDLTAARRHQLASLDAALTIGDHPGVAFAAEGMGGVAIAAGDPVHGALLLGGAAAIRDHLGLPLPPGEDFDVRRWERIATEDVGVERFRRSWDEGASLDLDGVAAATRRTIAAIDD